MAPVLFFLIQILLPVDSDIRELMLTYDSEASIWHVSGFVDWRFDLPPIAQHQFEAIWWQSKFELAIQDKTESRTLDANSIPHLLDYDKLWSQSEINGSYQYILLQIMFVAPIGFALGLFLHKLMGAGKIVKGSDKGVG